MLIEANKLRRTSRSVDLDFSLKKLFYRNQSTTQGLSRLIWNHFD